MKRYMCALLLALLLILPTGARGDASPTVGPAAVFAPDANAAPIASTELATAVAPIASVAKAASVANLAQSAAVKTSSAPAATAAASPKADVDGDVYAINDEQGNFITSIEGPIFVDDEYISSANKLYRIISVDDKAKTAVAKLIGDEDMTGASGGAVATLAQNSDKLIAMYSTHSDESYVPSDGTESKAKDAGIYDVDSALKSALEQKGIKVVLDETTHLPHDAGAYRRSRATAARLIKERPAALLDIHRDGIPNPGEYTQQIDGEDATKVRLLVGRSNPNAAANRAFAKQIKATADKLYPDLVKDIFIGKGDYNQELMPHAILIEFGTYTINKDRAEKSTRFVADVLNNVLFGATAKAEGAVQEKSAPNGANISNSATADAQKQSKSGGALWGILWVVGIAVGAIVIYGLVTTGSFSGMLKKIRRGASETTGGLIGKQKDKGKK